MVRFCLNFLKLTNAYTRLPDSHTLILAAYLCKLSIWPGNGGSTIFDIVFKFILNPSIYDRFYIEAIWRK
jgi:hypothetical protein